jgi:protein-ribulosamine 3-kinase
LRDRLPDLLGHQPAASLTHGDLWSGNYLPTAEGPALVDPACAYADRETDLALMAMFGGFSERVWAAYQEAWPLPDGWQQRQPLYQLYHYLNHHYLFGGGYGAQALALARSYT